MAECVQCRFLQGAVFAGERLFFEKSYMVCLHSVSYHHYQSIYSMVEGRPWSRFHLPTLALQARVEYANRIKTRQSSGALAQRYVRVLVKVYDFLSVNLNFVLSLIRILCKCSNFVLSLVRNLLLTSPNMPVLHFFHYYRIVNLAFLHASFAIHPTVRQIRPKTKFSENIKEIFT